MRTLQPDELDDADHHFRRYLVRPRRRRLERIVEAFHRFVWDTAFRVTGNAADAADIAQDVFLKLLLHPPRPEEVRSPRGFLAWEVVSRASSLRRAAERRKAREQVAASRACEDGLVAGGGISAAELDELRARVRELPEDLREALELRYFAGLKNADIALVTGVGERHVEKRLERAREVLRSRIGPVASLLVLLDRIAADGCPLEVSSEPPASLRADLLRITSAGAALAIPPATAVTTACGFTLGKSGVTAGVLAAILLLGGATTTVYFSTPKDRDARTIALRAPLTPRPRPPITPPSAGTLESALAPSQPEPSPPYGWLRGTVLDEGGRPIPGARVTLTGAIVEDVAAYLRQTGFPDAKSGPVERETLTGEAGEYSFDRLYPVMVRISVEQSPYLPNWVGKATVRAGQEAKHQYDFILCLPLRLHGTVRTPEGEAVKGAQIFLNFDYAKHYYSDSTEPEPALEHAFPVNEQGEFDTGFGIVNVFPNHSHSGYVLAPGREMKRFKFCRGDFRDSEARIDLVLAPERRLTVLVEEISGAPVAGATVRVGDLEIHKVVTDGRGRATLNRLPELPFSINVEKEGYHDESVHAATVDSSEIRILLQALGPGIEGQVTFDDAVPEANREADDVYFYELGPGDKPVRAIHNVGFKHKTSTFQSHPKGPLRFEALCELGWRTLTQKPLVYDGQNKLRVDFHVRLEPPYISGRVLRATTREPLPGVRVQLHLPWRDEEAAARWGSYKLLNSILFPQLPGNRSVTSTGADGSFLFLLSATDRYHPGTPLRRRAILTAGMDESILSADETLDLDIRADTVVKDVELEVPAPGAIEGQVLDEAGHPLSSALVAAYDGYHVVKQVRASGAGQYRIEDLRPGRYLIEFLGHASYFIKSSGGGEVDAEGLPPPSEYFERPVRVEAGETTRWDLDLRTDALGAIDGVVPAELKGITGVTCNLIFGGRPRGGSAFERESGVNEGRFQLENLFPGTYRVWVSGESASEVDVVVRRGPRTRLVMPSPASGTLVIPIENPGSAQLGSAKLVELRRLESNLREGQPVWTSITASKVTDAGGLLLVESLVSGNLQATILIPGFQALRSEPVWVAQGREAVAPAVVLLPGRAVHVRLELEDGVKLPEEPTFTVIDPRTGVEVLVHVTRRGESLLWDLSGFPDGTFTIHVDATYALKSTPVDVTVSGERDMESRILLERRTD